MNLSHRARIGLPFAAIDQPQHAEEGSCCGARQGPVEAFSFVTAQASPRSPGCIRFAFCSTPGAMSHPGCYVMSFDDHAPRLRRLPINSCRYTHTSLAARVRQSVACHDRDECACFRLSCSLPASAGTDPALCLSFVHESGNARLMQHKGDTGPLSLVLACEVIAASPGQSVAGVFSDHPRSLVSLLCH